MVRESPHTIVGLALVTLALAYGDGVAAPGPVGPVFPANGIEVPGDFTKSCTEAGITTRLVEKCAHDYCDEPVHVFVEQRDAAGNLVRSRTRATKSLARPFSSRLTCGDDGGFVVSWSDLNSDCAFIRVYDRALVERSSIFHLGGTDACPMWEYPTLTIYPDRSILAVWNRREGDAATDVVARRFTAEGKPSSAVVALNEVLPSWSGRGATALDASGYALVAWSATLGELDERVRARLLDPAGRVVGPMLEVSTRRAWWIGGPFVLSTGDGEFEVVWTDWLLGDWVARRVSIDAASATPVTTTTLPAAPSGFPAFESESVLTSPVEYGQNWIDPEVYDGAGSAWYVRVRDQIYRARSDIRRWLSPFLVGGDPYYHAGATTTDGHGRWFTFSGSTSYPASSLELRTSVDDGSTWEEPRTIATWPHVSKSCDYCEVPRVVVDADPLGTIIAVWSFYDSTDRYESRPGEAVVTKRLFAARSRDNGLTWDAPITVAVEPDRVPYYLDLETDGEGNWIVGWGDEIQVWIARSTDDGKTWSLPTVLVDAATTQVDLAAGDGGTWVIAFESKAVGDDEFGSDFDVFSVRSTDEGATWDEIVPINIYARTDRSTDMSPSIATDGNGNWLSLWMTHHPIADPASLDGDVAAAMSTDGGRTWSAPVTINAGAAADTSREIAPSIRADERGVWLASWHSAPLDATYDATTHDIVVALAGDRCGDANTDAGEECDDANRIDGDGCDTNCTRTACGNGIASPDEPCDDNNESNEDTCLNDCRLARCGDGFVQLGVEPCDDGNLSNRDNCLLGCRAAACGDGFVRTGSEECDDGNDSNADACPETCTIARCGDGFVHPADEECDDGNDLDEDGCVGECRAAVCGDGHVRFGVESCDPGIWPPDSKCPTDCGLDTACGDPDGDGRVAIRDAQRILRAAVGLKGRCPLVRCDVNGDRGVTVTDARLALHMAIGLDARVECPSSHHVVFTLADPIGLGSLQFDVEYDVSRIHFSTPNVDHLCTLLIPSAFAAYNDQEEIETLSMAVIRATEFVGPRDVARCAYSLPQGGREPPLRIRVTDAATADFTWPDPAPRITYRFE